MAAPHHPIFQAIIQADYAGGWQTYLALDEPGAADHRWGGYCLFALGQLLPAKDLLMQAKAEGCASAGIELAAILRYLGDLSAAHYELDIMMKSDLPALDQAAAFRERGALYLYEGRAAQAQTVLEAAWRAVSSLGHAGQPFLAPTAQLLGYTYALLGREAPAVHYLNLALDVVVGVKRVHPLHSRAQIHTQMGRYVQAISDLQEASAHLPGLNSAAAHQAYLEGMVSSAQGHWTQATAFLSQAREQARTSGETGTEYLAELGLASVLTVQADYDAARAHLLRAEHLSGNVWEQALFALRSGSWAAAQGQAAQDATRSRPRRLHQAGSAA